MNLDSQDSNDIPAYEAFRQAAIELTQQSISLGEFTRILKTDLHLKQLRSAARNEFKRIYDKVAKKLSLPNIPVFLPVRKKVSTRGQAHSICGSPTEIRVYPIEGVSGVSYDEWRPQDITICSKLKAFEILKHEIAHVVATHRMGEADDHDQNFVSAYDELNAYFKANGYSAIIDPNLELWGCPPGSYADKQSNLRLRKSYSESGSKSQGCFTVLFVMVVIVLPFLFV